MAELTLSQDRQHLLLEAIYEIDKLSRVLPDLVPLEEGQTHYAVKGVCGRMMRLTTALMSGIGDEHAKDENLRDVIHFGAVGQG